MSKKKKIFLATIAILVIALIVVTVQMQNGGPEGIEVQTSGVGKQKIVQTVTATGRIQPKTQVKISADVSAKIVQLPVKEGDWVERGDLLTVLDGERLQAVVESAEAIVSSAKANAKLAKENMLKTEKDYLRTKELFDKNLESQAALDAMFAAFEVEKARYESALDQVEQTKASLKQAADNFSKTKIYAPMSGTVSRLNKEMGEIALGSQFQEDVIMIISNLSGMEALVEVDENDIVNVAIGDSATIEVDAIPDRQFVGMVTEIANSANITGQGTSDQKTEFEVKIAVTGLKNSSTTDLAASSREVKVSDTSTLAQLRPGMTASSDIVTDTREEALGVPIQCVTVRTPEQLKPQTPEGKNLAIADDSSEQQFFPDKDGFCEIVFVINNGIAQARQVKTGIQSETHIEILEGLSEGDEIVVGNYRAISKDLSNGSKVVVNQGNGKNNQQ
jgi:HlyD family secretion protein